MPQVTISVSGSACRRRTWAVSLLAAQTSSSSQNATNSVRSVSMPVFRPPARPGVRTLVTTRIRRSELSRDRLSSGCSPSKTTTTSKCPG